MSGPRNNVELTPGTNVLITNQEDLVWILNRFSPTLECISPFSIEEIADHYATLVEVVQAPPDYPEMGDFAVLLFENGKDIVLPLHGFAPINMKIEEFDDEDTVHQPAKEFAHYVPRDIVADDVPSNTTIVHDMAAECIQSAFRYLMQLTKVYLMQLILMSLSPANIFKAASSLQTSKEADKNGVR